MKTLKLKVNPRFGIRGLLNEKYGKGGLTLDTLKTAQDIMAKVLLDIKWATKLEKDGSTKAIGGEEAKRLNIRQFITQGQPQIGWDLNKDKGKDIEFDGDEIKLLIDLIKDKNTSKELKLDDAWIQDVAKQLEII